jgi:hypothetical protein
MLTTDSQHRMLSAEVETNLLIPKKQLVNIGNVNSMEETNGYGKSRY